MEFVLFVQSHWAEMIPWIFGFILVPNLVWFIFLRVYASRVADLQASEREYEEALQNKQNEIDRLLNQRSRVASFHLGVGKFILRELFPLALDNFASALEKGKTPRTQAHSLLVVLATQFSPHLFETTKFRQATALVEKRLPECTIVASFDPDTQTLTLQMSVVGTDAHREFAKTEAFTFYS